MMQINDEYYEDLDKEKTLKILDKILKGETPEPGSYRGRINNEPENNRKTLMLMHGENFSIIPLTTHINIKNVHKFIRRNFLNNFCKNILLNLKNNIYKLNFKNIKFLCYNPHCGEEGTLGKEDILIKNVIKNHKEINGIFAADSAFNNLHNNTLFISVVLSSLNLLSPIIKKIGIK